MKAEDVVAFYAQKAQRLSESNLAITVALAMVHDKQLARIWKRGFRGARCREWRSTGHKDSKDARRGTAKQLP